MRFKKYFFSLKSNIFLIITSKRKCLIEVYYDSILRKKIPRQTSPTKTPGALQTRQM